MIPLLLALAAPPEPDVVVTVTFGNTPVTVGLELVTPRGRLRDRQAALLNGWKPSADGSDPLDRLAPDGRLWRVQTPGPSHHAEAVTLALAKALDTNGDGLISEAEYKAAAKVWLAKFDADGDECLTPLEIVPDLLTRPPEKRGAAPRVTVAEGGPGGTKATASMRPDSSSGFRSTAHGGRLEVVAPVFDSPTSVELPKALLRPGREAERGRFEAVAREVVTITVRPEPRGWLELFDLNGDGQLSARELRAAEKQLFVLSLPDGLRVPDYSAAAVTITLTPGTTSPPPVRLTKVPVPAGGWWPPWFVAMDRNGDGDVSRKEFAGTDAQFQQYDADGDGLISADEAAAGDQRLKPGGKP